MNEIKVVNEQTVLGKNFKIYGDFENPLFLAKDVAEWIDYSKTKEGFYQVSQMLANVDDDEKLTINILNSEGKAHNQSFLTEDGLYEVLMLSRKPIAKQFKKEENWYSIKELAEGFGVHPDTISGNLRSIFGKGLKTYRKMQVNGKARTYLYNETAKNELMRRFAQNQLNKANNSTVGKLAVKEVMSQKIEDVTFLKLIQQNEEIIRRNDELIRQNNEILKSLQNTMNYITGKTPISENDRIRKDIQDYIMMYSEKEKISYEQGIKEFIDEFEYRNHINLRIRSKRNGYNSILEYADKNNLLPELLEVARNMR